MYNCHADKGFIHNPLSTWQLYIFHCTQNIIHCTLYMAIIHYTFYIIHHIPLSSTIFQSSILPFSLSKFTPTFVIGKFDKEKRLR